MPERRRVSLALLLAARMLNRQDYRWQLAVATGVVLGLGQLVRAFSLWTFAARVERSCR